MIVTKPIAASVNTVIVLLAKFNFLFKSKMFSFFFNQISFFDISFAQFPGYDTSKLVL